MVTVLISLIDLINFYSFVVSFTSLHDLFITFVFLFTFFLYLLRCIYFFIFIFRVVLLCLLASIQDLLCLLLLMCFGSLLTFDRFFCLLGECLVRGGVFVFLGFGSSLLLSLTLIYNDRLFREDYSLLQSLYLFETYFYSSYYLLI